MTTEPATPRPASTVLLLRDCGAALEVFMVVRHHEIDFMPGALVFPGGSLDAADADPGLARLCAGVAGLDDLARAHRIAAVREVFEECGVLLARPRGEAGLVAADRLAALERYRPRLEAGEITMRAFCETEELELACDLMTHFAHWITPVTVPKRYDTHFFLAAAPAGHLALHDGSESTDSIWIAPAAALADAEAKKRTIVFPTRLNLQKLGENANVAEALARAGAEPVVTVLPEVRQTPSGPMLDIPPEAGYGDVTAAMDNIRRG